MADRTLEVLLVAQDNISNVIGKVADKFDDLDDQVKNVDKTIAKTNKSGINLGRTLEVAIGGVVSELAQMAGRGALDFLKRGFDQNSKANADAYKKTIEEINGAIDKLAQILTKPLFDLFLAGANGLLAIMPQIVATVQSFIDGLAALPNSPFGQWIANELIPALEQAGASINKSLQPALAALQPIMDELGRIVGPIVAEGLRLLGEHITRDVIPGIVAWTRLTLDAIPLMIELGKAIGGEINAAIATFAGWWNTLAGYVSTAVSNIQAALDAMNMLAEFLQGSLADAFNWFIENVIAPFTQALAALKNYIGQVISAFEKLAGIGGGGLPGIPQAPTGGTTPQPGAGFAMGGSFIVPPGYPNDTFPIRVTSGERVTVSPRGSSGGSFVFNVSVSNDAMLNALMRKVRALAMLNAV